MRRITQIFVPLFLLVVVLGACAKTEVNTQTTSATTTVATTTTLAQTGYPSGEIQRPQVVYGGCVYLYVAEGVSNPLPSGFAAAGAVETVDNRALSEKPDWCGSRVEVGQRIFANADQPDTLYLEYAEG
ncbi:MAG: hypothetical protein IKU55_00420, partial [Clostridia bacterium]|nr:hypothetical protein [Clostridia bacterium]